MREKSAVFDETYQDYLERLSHVDLISRAEMLGAVPSGDGLVIPFLGETYRVSPRGVTPPPGMEGDFAVNVVLLNYVLRWPAAIPDDGRWLTYRDFRGAGPLETYFTANTLKIIEETFEGRLSALESACLGLGGVDSGDGAAYDFSITFDALPKIPVFLRFNDRDDEFPPSCSVLFRQSASSYLDLESLAILGTLLAANLTGAVGPA